MRQNLMPRITRLILSGQVCLMGLTLCACAVGPNFKTPEAPKAEGYGPILKTGSPLQAGDPTPKEIRFETQYRVPARWWTQFEAPQLDALVDEALANNADLKAAEAALKQADEVYRAGRGQLLPSFDLQGSVSRQKASKTNAPPLNESNPPYTFEYNLYNSQVNVAYTFDVFGGVARGIEQSKAQAEQQGYQTRAARQTLIANVVNTAIQVASLKSQLKAAETAVSSAEQTLVILKTQARLGGASGFDLAAQEQALAQAKTQLPPLQKGLQQQLHLLAALLGRGPDRLPDVTFGLEDLKRPAKQPLVLPAELVRTRPDVLASEANLHAAAAGVGKAIAARLPSLSLSGSVGNLSRTFNGRGEFWTESLGLSAPLFHGFTLAHQQKAAEAAYDQAKAQYRSSVLGAMQSVADSLQALQSDQDGVLAAKTNERAAERTFGLTQKQLELGQVNLPTLLLAQNTLASARSARVQAEALQLTDQVAFYQALGGEPASR